MQASAKPIPWFEPGFDEADAEAVKQMVLSTFVNEGSANRIFEQKLREYFGVSSAVTTPNCTTAIALALMALDIGHGDTVLVPDLTFIGTASAVRLAGAEPILVDIDPADFNMDPEDAARRLQPSTKAIIPVHLNGRPANMARLCKLAKDKGLVVVEDVAEALGSRNAKGYLGTLSEAGCFSLAPTKIITSGQGGFLLTHRVELYQQIIRLKDHGRLSRESDEHPVTGFNFKFTDIQAALALSQWNKLPQRIKRSKIIDQLYMDGLKEIEDIEWNSRPQDPEGYLMWPDFKTKRRNDLVYYLGEHHIKARPFWPAIHTQPAYRSSGDYPGATEASRHGCWLPCSPGITDEQVQRVITVIKEFFASTS